MKAKKGLKFDGQGEGGSPTKNRWELMPFKELREVVQVLTAGAMKYKDFNWIYVRPISRYRGALERHYDAWLGGEEYDPDLFERSGAKISHLACLVCNALFLMWFDKHIPGWMEKEQEEYNMIHKYEVSDE